jgi:NAD(P)-dependent dehydrogenase (short-subunit alcohol dehydrogenase family)
METQDYGSRRESSWLLWGVLGFAGGLALKQFIGQRNEINVGGKTALITGGSRGLGLLLAKELLLQGATVAICARDSEELERAKHHLSQFASTNRIVTLTGDVSNQEEAEALVHDAIEHMGRLDILINNAGIIIVGPAQEMKLDDFEQVMSINFYGTLNMIYAALPHFRARQQGRIVNISSVGGRISVPHLLPYSCSKFAVNALSEGLRAELARDGITVTTIMPGTMRTGSHYQAYAKGDQEAEYTNFALSATLPGVSIAAETAARQIVTALRRGEAERIVSVPAQLLATFHSLFPGVTADMFACVNSNVLPDPTGTQVRDTGKTVARRISSPILRFLTSLGDSAAHRLNQRPPHDDDAPHHPPLVEQTGDGIL